MIALSKRRCVGRNGRTEPEKVGYNHHHSWSAVILAGTATWKEIAPNDVALIINLYLHRRYKTHRYLLCRFTQHSQKPTLTNQLQEVQI